ncbi:site-2 protease family protein [Falsigemmobacter faecalis]|uniref:M50 family peptidase n=1 Tax=Falsigemmobacter faecalis TaxID=2488730 RepID=A0A3P3DJG9_9RHOB|nr:site-2 protease family protein [Falsigemmobacter faecalis]RRH73846.1 M50 family peptidase [Falsigemmobacter faecalis]
MDLPRPALVKQIELHLSAEGRGFSYLLADRVSGQILRLSRRAALGYRGLAEVVARGGQGAAALDPEEARLGFGALAWVRQLRDAVRFRKKPFNPMSLQLPLFDASRIQPFAAPLAPHVFGLPGLMVLLGLMALAAVLGVRNDWKIMAEFNEVFSLEALLTFGAVAPFLKILHEFGHVLAATACGVRLRQAGVNIIGFYPIPYVDCSEADLTASRRQRMLISGAGIVTDIVLGFVLFLVWHLLPEGELRQVVGRAFVFAVFSSLLLNANPLMRMDGYFLLADALNHRNLGTDATAALKRGWRGALGLSATPRQFGRGYEAWLALYGVSSMFYRWFVLFTLVWQVLPRYLGLGLFLGLWGGWMMLAAPTLSRLSMTPPPAPPGAGAEGGERPGSHWRKALAAGLGLGLTALLFVPIAPRVVLDVVPDSFGHYALSLPQPGFVAGHATGDGLRAAGDPLVVLVDSVLDARLALASLALAEAQHLVRIGSASGAAGLQRGLDQLELAQEQHALLKAERDALFLTAPAAGRFTLTQQMKPGEHLAAGSVAGRFMPEGAALSLVAAMPEGWVEHFDRGLIGAELRLDGRYHPLEPAALRLAEELRHDNASGGSAGRSFTLHVTAPLTAGEVETGAGQVRLVFGKIAGWRHLAGWVEGKISEFRNAEIAEKQQRLERNSGSQAAEY